jgi:hypothetical protein
VSFSAVVICEGAVVPEGGGQPCCVAAEPSAGSVTAPAAIAVDGGSGPAAAVAGSSMLPAPSAMATVLAMVKRPGLEGLAMAVFFLVNSAGPAGYLALGSTVAVVRYRLLLGPDEAS